MRDVSMMPGQIAFTRMPAPADLLGHARRQCLEAGLRRGVGRRVRAELLAGDRRDVHDRSAVARRRSCSRPNTFDMRNEPVRFTSMTVRHSVGVEVDDRLAVLAARRAGVVHDDVDAAELARSTCAASASTAPRSDTSDTSGERSPADGADLVGHRLDVAPAGRLLVVGVAIGRAAGAGEHDVAAGLRPARRRSAGRSSACDRRRSRRRPCCPSRRACRPSRAQ